MISYDGKRPLTEVYEAELCGIKISAANRVLIERLVDKRLRDYPPRGLDTRLDDMKITTEVIHVIQFAPKDDLMNWQDSDIGGMSLELAKERVKSWNTVAYKAVYRIIRRTVVTTDQVVT